ncbi:hypothetical protein EGO58_11920, partial [Limosilactobacillus reuteri]
GEEYSLKIPLYRREWDEGLFWIFWRRVFARRRPFLDFLAKSIRSYNFIKASEGSLAGVFKLFFQTVGDCFSNAVSVYAKAMVHDNFNVLETLMSMPRAFIRKVPGSVVVTICTSGASDRLELRGAFDISKETFGRKLKNSRLRVFSRAIVEDSIKVMKAMKTEDGKPLPITEDSVYAFIMGNVSNVHCTRAGLLGGSKATVVSSVSKGLVARGAATKAFSGFSGEEYSLDEGLFWIFWRRVFARRRPFLDFLAKSIRSTKAFSG